MHSKIVGTDEAAFPSSFWLLQQEAILANSCIRTGFEFLVKGGFDDIYKGHYYTAFFQISIGLERILKLILISDHMLKNGYKAPETKEITSFGHDLVRLYRKATTIETGTDAETVCNDALTENEIQNAILIFMNDFAAATGRYHNISNMNARVSEDPLLKWKEVIKKIIRSDFNERKMHRIESEVANRLNPNLQIQDIAFDTGYVSGVYNFVSTSRANYYAVWNTLSLIEPLLQILSNISMESHERDTSSMQEKNWPSIPYYDEIFTLRYISKQECLRKKRWTNY